MEIRGSWRSARRVGAAERDLTRHGQAAAIGFALAVAPDKMWDKQTTPLTKMHVQHWLLSINDLKIPNNNWLFFKVNFF